MSLTRMLVGICVFTFFASIIGCATQDAEQSISVNASTAETPAPDTPTTWDPKSGLLIIGVRAYSMDNHDKISKDRAVLNGIAVKNTGTNTVYNIPLDQDGAVKVLPGGDYCIYSFRTYLNVNLEYCKEPFFSILPGQAINMGYVLLGVNYRGSANSIRFWPYSLYKYKRELSNNLTGDEHKRVREFIEKVFPGHDGVSDSVWYSYDQGGNTYALWFNRGGNFYFQPNPGSIFKSGHEGKWKADGNNLTFSLDEFDRHYEGTVAGDFMSGIAWDTKDGSRWVWFATKDPTRQPSYNESPQAKVIYQDSTPYPSDLLAKGVTGSVTIHYKLPLPGEGINDLMPTVNPDSMTIVDSQPKGVFDKAALDAFQYAFYANAVKDGKPVPSEGEETIRYQIVNGIPVVSYSSQLQPLAPPEH